MSDIRLKKKRSGRMGVTEQSVDGHWLYSLLDITKRLQIHIFQTNTYIELHIYNKYI